MYQCACCGAMWPHEAPYCGSCGKFNSLRELSEEQVQKIFLERPQHDPIDIDLLRQAEGDDEGDVEPDEEDEEQITRVRAVRMDKLTDANVPRISTGFANFDHFLGGGLPLCSVTLVGGEAGLGKSTLLRQVSIQLASRGETVLWASGEEAQAQTRHEFSRLGARKLDLRKIRLLSSGTLEDVLFEIDKKQPALVVLDSLQVFYSEEAGGAPRTPRQAKWIAEALYKLSHDLSLPIFLVCHITKEGSFAGPETVKHWIDITLLLERDEQKRIVGTSIKNRFGPTDRPLKFEMTETGLSPILEEAC